MIILIKDRYSGAYSGGEWTAWEVDHPARIPISIDADDCACAEFWDELRREPDSMTFAVGKTADEAHENLRAMLKW